MRDPWSVIALTLYLISVFPAHAQVSPRLVPEMGLSGIDSVAFSPNGHLVLTGKFFITRRGSGTQKPVVKSGASWGIRAQCYR